MSFYVDFNPKAVYDNLTDATVNAAGFALDDHPARVYRDASFTDLAAVVHHDGAIDFYR